MNTITTITVKEIAEICEVSQRAIRKRAQKEKRALKRAGKNKAKRFQVCSLPDDIKIAIAAHSAKCQVQSTGQPPGHLPAPASGDTTLCQTQLDKGMAKADLLRLYLRALKKAKHGRKTRTRTEFMRAYNSGITYPNLYKIIGQVSWKTIEGWKQKLKASGDTMALADRRGYRRRGQRILTDQQIEILLRCALHPNKPLISEAIRMAWAVMHARGIPNGHSESTYRRWLEDWASVNHHIWTFSRKGAKAWNDEVAMYIERDYSLINVGDVLVADGHVLNFEILNPWTGKPKRMTLIVWLDMKSSFPLGWEIMPTENTEAISAALRRAILRLGKYPQVAYLDNGKAFKARFFQGVDFDEAGFSGLYERLGIKTIFAWPYHGQSKTVERFFGTFAELERWCPTYTGTSIEKKPPRMMRGEKLHRRVYNKVMGDNCLTLENAHRAIAAWFDEYAQRPQRGHLAGRAPVELFLQEKGPGIDKSELTWLMMSQAGCHIRQNGIRFLGQNYYNPALYGRKHKASIRYDLQDPSAIYVYDQHGEYICQATPIEKCHPAAEILGTDEDRERLRKYIELKKSQEKEAGILAREFLETEVLPQHRRMLERSGVTETGPDKKIKSLPEPIDEQKIMAEVRQIEKAQASGVEIWDEILDLNDMDWYEKLTEMDCKGVLIPAREQAWMKYYEQTPEYAGLQDYFEEYKIKMALTYKSTESTAL